MNGIERLEVEDEEARVRRFQRTFEKLNASSNASSLPPKADINFDFGERKTFPVGPSELLARVQAFLPQMEASNVELAQRMEADPESVNMESIPEGMDKYIQMNLGLGVFTTKPTENAGMSPSSDTSDSTSSNSTEEDDSSDYDSDSSDESGIISSFLPPHLSATPSRMIKPIPRRSLSDRLHQQQKEKISPHIVVLGSSNSSPDTDSDMSPAAGPA